MVDKMKNPNELSFNYKCRLYANSIGHSGEIGGWIYDIEGKPICQGWVNYYKSYGKRIERFITNRYLEKKQ